jgi:glucosamine-6-phosphate deaminase
LRIRIFRSANDAAARLAERVSKAVAANPSIVLGLPTGRTQIPFYRELTARAARRRIDFSRATTFNLDEFVGLGEGDAGSYRAFMQAHLFDRVNLRRRRIHFLDGRATDLARECADYERAIARAGGLDVLVLGLGANGHIGFNEPADRLEARTHRARLTRPTRAANRLLFGGQLRRVPREALSMGMATILHARRIALLATGSGKARAVAAMIRGPLTTRVPASFLQVHRDVEVWLDEPAAQALPSSWRRRPSTSSPIASRTKSWAFRIFDSDCG